MARKTTKAVMLKIQERQWFALQCVLRNAEFQKDFKKLRNMGMGKAELESYAEALPRMKGETYENYCRRISAHQEKTGIALRLTTLLSIFNKKWSVSASYRYPKYGESSLNSVDLQPAVGGYIFYPGSTNIVPWPYALVRIDLRRDIEEIVMMVRECVLSERKVKTSNVKPAELLNTRVSNLESMLRIWDLRNKEKRKKTFREIATVLLGRKPSPEDIRTIRENYKRCDQLIKGDYKYL